MRRLTAFLFAVVVLSSPALAPAIDLVADSLTVDPTHVDPGQAMSITGQGHVEGTGTVGGPFTIGFYLSLDENISATNDLLLQQVTESTAQNPGQTFTAQLTVIIPQHTPPGTYYVGMIVDDTNAIAESNETNNIEYHRVTVGGTVTQPNLAAVSCSVAPSTIRPGDEVLFTWRGRNNGSSTAALFEWGIYLSTDTTLGTGDTLLHSGTVVTGWAAGYDTGDQSVTLTINSSLAAGHYYVGILLDTQNTVHEVSETDNQCVADLIVTTATGVTRWLIPAAASAPGYGTSNWKSQIEIVNPTSDDRSANLTYVAKGAAWPGSSLGDQIALPALSASYLDDPLLPLNPTSGLVVVTLDAPGPVATSRTYNLGSGGATYGQGIPAIALDGATAPQRLVLPMAHSVTGHFHTNLGLVQTSSGTSTFEVTVYSPEGLPYATKSYTRSTAYDQINDLFSNMGISVSVEGAWIVVRLTSGSPTYWTCYASIVDDLTGDPAFIPPVEP